MRDKSMLDFINACMSADRHPITREEFAEIRRNGDPDEIAEAVERMEAAGGYDNLE